MSTKKNTISNAPKNTKKPVVVTAKADSTLVQKVKDWAKAATEEELRNALARSSGVAYKIVLEEFQTRKNQNTKSDLESFLADVTVKTE